MSTTADAANGLAGTKEAAAIFGVRTQNFRRDWARRPDFPAPIADLAATPVWRREDLERYRDRDRASRWPPRRRDMKLSPAAERWLPTVKRRLVRGFHPDRILLFGSQARGDAKEGSDVDLLVVIPTVIDRRRAAASMYASLTGVPVATDIVVVSVADVERYAGVHGTILTPALADGVSLYERAR